MTAGFQMASPYLEVVEHGNFVRVRTRRTKRMLGRIECNDLKYGWEFFPSPGASFTPSCLQSIVDYMTKRWVCK